MNESLCIYLTALFCTIVLLTIVEVMNYRSAFEKPIRFHEGNIIIVKGRILVLLSFLPMWYLLAFRNITVGTDTRGTYYRIFKAILHGSTANYVKTETGYYYLNKFILSFTDSYHIIIIVVSTITWLLFFSYICKMSVSPSISIIIFFLSFFYFRQYNGVRQLLAEAIAIQGIRYIYERNLIKYVICIMTAFLFHNTVLILLPVYYLYIIRLDRKKAIMIIAASKILCASAVQFILPTILYGTKYYRMIYDIRAYRGGYWYSDIIVSSIILLVALVKLDSNATKEYNFNVWLIVLTAVLAYNSNQIPMVGRIMWYTYINVAVFIPSIIKRYNSFLGKIYSVGMLLGVYMAYFVQQWSLGIERVQEYKTWIDKL